MGFPLDATDECPPGFMVLSGETESSKGRFSTIYCVLTSKIVRNAHQSKFRSFCMFLVDQRRETCPKGFDMKRTFMRTRLRSTGKYSMFRKEGSNSIWLTLCCTNGSHVDKSTEFPKLTVSFKRIVVILFIVFPFIEVNFNLPIFWQIG